MEIGNHKGRVSFRCAATLAVIVLLPLGAGCDPCMNNPCDDGLACNGIELCTADGAQAVCSDGTPIECASGETCSEPDGVCLGQECSADEDCDDGDNCTVDSCDQATGTCDSTPRDCPTGQTCDSSTGQCVGDGTGAGTATTLLGAGGTYSGSRTCGDDDDRVTLTDNGGTLTLSGFQGNNDITFTLVNDTTATATGVVAFGNPGHTLTLMLDPATGDISFDLSVAGTCATDLMTAP